MDYLSLNIASIKSLEWKKKKKRRELANSHIYLKENIVNSKNQIGEKSYGFLELFNKIYK